MKLIVCVLLYYTVLNYTTLLYSTLHYPEDLFISLLFYLLFLHLTQYLSILYLFLFVIYFKPIMYFFSLFSIPFYSIILSCLHLWHSPHVCLVVSVRTYTTYVNMVRTNARKKNSCRVFVTILLQPEIEKKKIITKNKLLFLAFEYCRI